ncbi:MAG TPA: sigma-70 family RNA polymerase sigma factor [Polyangiaceae bacterium]
MVDAPRAEPLDLRELFTMHAPYVWNSLRRLGVLASDLEDLTHDVFVQVQRHLGEYDASRPLRPWLFGFAFRIASQYWRRAHRRRERSADAAVARAVDPSALPDQRLAAEQDRQLVLSALEAIDLDRRAVFVLYEIDGVPMAEIARLLGIPVNTAYSRLRVARTEFAAAVRRLRRSER